MNKIRNFFRSLVAQTIRVLTRLFGGANSNPAPTPAPAPAPAPKSGDTIPGHYLVVLHPENGIQPMTEGFGLTPHRTYSDWGFAAKLSDDQHKALSADARVKSIEPDIIIMLDPMEKATSPTMLGPQGEQPAQQMPPGIHRIGAHLSKTANIGGPTGHRVDNHGFTIDTGCQLTHPDINVASDGGATFVEGTTSADDDHGHGTHCSGIMAAMDNGIGVVGVAPGATIHPVKVLDKNGSGKLSDVVAGIDYVTKYCTDNKITTAAANMSLGGEFKNQAMDEAIARSVAAGVCYGVAAGNSSRDAATFSPASHPDVICTSAIADYDGIGGGQGTATCRDDADDSFAGFSNFGKVVKIAAPGVCVLSTYKGSDYKIMSGTSMAAPHVTGACLLYRASHPKATPVETRQALIDAGKPQVDPPDAKEKFGFTGDPDEFAEPLLYVSTF